MTKAQLCRRIEEERIIAIVRKFYGDDLLFLTEALLDAGISTLEVTFDQQDPDCVKKTSGAIAAVLNSFGNRCSCGAGTVLAALTHISSRTYCRAAGFLHPQPLRCSSGR